MTSESEGLLIIAFYIWLQQASYGVFLTTLVLCICDSENGASHLQRTVIEGPYKFPTSEFYCTAEFAEPLPTNISPMDLWMILLCYISVLHASQMKFQFLKMGKKG